MQQRFYKKSAMVLAKKLRELGTSKDDKVIIFHMEVELTITER